MRPAAPALPALLLIFSAATASAFRPYNKAPEAKTAWMSISSQKAGQDYYLEATAEGDVLSRTESAGIVATKRGKIKPQLAKDLFREIDNSEIISAQGALDSRLVFYKGETLRVSAYVSGELKAVNAPLSNYGEAFAYAFGEVRKAVARLPADASLKGLLCAEQISGMELEEYRLNASKSGGSASIETSDLVKTPVLLRAIKQPLRLIPLENEAEVKQLQDFIAAHSLYGLLKLFYLPSTRGTFKCRVLESAARRR